MELCVLAKTKLDFSRLTTKIYHASQHVIVYRRREPSMDTNELRALVTSVAIRNGLDYLNGDVEQMVVAAILVMATESKENPERAEAARAKAIEDAWTAYDELWESKIVH